MSPARTPRGQGEGYAACGDEVHGDQSRYSQRWRELAASGRSEEVAKAQAAREIFVTDVLEAAASAAFSVKGLPQNRQILWEEETQRSERALPVPREGRARDTQLAATRWMVFLQRGHE